jgi:hypothetical protein
MATVEKNCPESWRSASISYRDITSQISIELFRFVPRDIFERVGTVEVTELIFRQILPAWPFVVTARSKAWVLQPLAF